MSERFEDLIKNNRASFDIKVPDNSLWKEIETKLFPVQQQRPVIGIYTVFKVAALFGIIAIGVTLMNTRKESTLPFLTTHTIELPPDDSLELAYQSEIRQMVVLVRTKQARVKEIQKKDSLLTGDFIAAANKADLIYRQLEKELSENPNQELILEAMLQNLNFQSQLVEKQLDVLQSRKKEKNENRKNSRNI